MISGMLANDIDDRHLRPAGIVQIGESIAKPGTEMKKSACRFVRHARITVCRSSDHSLEETKHAAHLPHSVKCSNDMYLRGARVSEADFNASGDQRANQTFCPVHLYYRIIFPGGPLKNPGTADSWVASQAAED